MSAIVVRRMEVQTAELSSRSDSCRRGVENSSWSALVGLRAAILAEILEIPLVDTAA